MLRLRNSINVFILKIKAEKHWGSTRGKRKPPYGGPSNEISRKSGLRQIRGETFENQFGHHRAILGIILDSLLNQELTIAGEFSGEIAPKSKGIFLVSQRKIRKDGFNRLLNVGFEEGEIGSFFVTGEHSAIVDGECPIAL